MQILNKNKALLSLITFLAIIFIIGIVFDDNMAVTQASADDNVSGWAWSSNIGWISFNCTNDTPPCDSSNYGVDVDRLTGDFSGYAWSSNIGWIDFGPSPVPRPFPAEPYHGFRLGADGTVTGWARALSADDNGWDGWIKSDGTATGWSDSVRLNPAGDAFEGYAWGGEVIGWIEFNPSFGGVDFDGILPTAECEDGIDNDGDSWIDFPADPGCTSASDMRETQATNYSVSSSNNIIVQLFNDQPSTSSETTLRVNMVDDGDPDFTGPVNLSVDSIFPNIPIPPGASFNFNGVTTADYNLPASEYATGIPFSVNVPPGTPDTSYIITIRAAGGGVGDTFVNVLLNSSTIDIKFKER